MSREEAFSWCAGEGLESIEMGVGGWAKAPHHLPLDLLLRERGERERLLSQLSEHGLALSCVNAAGNPLHPDPPVGARHAALVRGAVELASQLGVERVVTMSGCPGGRDGGTPVFAPWALVPDDEPLWNWQFEHHLAPFWRELGSWARQTAPSVLICLELHAGASAYNPGTFRMVAEAGGTNICVNLDPSHFWWQGIDPLAVLDEVADRVAFSHGKDTVLHPDRIAVDGVLDFRFPVDPATATWHFGSVGTGRSIEEWRALLSALRAAGYDGDVSIEHEDPRVEAEQGIRESHAALRAALAQVPAA
jgi:sugar phosphate isomerase/epimerase